MNISYFCERRSNTCCSICYSRNKEKSCIVVTNNVGSTTESEMLFTQVLKIFKSSVPLNGIGKEEPS